MSDFDASERSDRGTKEPDLENNDVLTANELADFRTIMQRAQEIYSEQEICGNREFAEKIMSASSSNAIQVEEI